MIEMDALNHNLGLYVRLAFGAKKYPDKPFGYKPPKVKIDKPQSEEEINNVFISIAQKWQSK